MVPFTSSSEAIERSDDSQHNIRVLTHEGNDVAIFVDMNSGVQFQMSFNGRRHSTFWLTASVVDHNMTDDFPVISNLFSILTLRILVPLEPNLVSRSTSNCHTSRQMPSIVSLASHCLALSLKCSNLHSFIRLDVGLHQQTARWRI